MAWKLSELSSGGFTLDNEELEAGAVPEVLKKLTEHFGERLAFGGKFGLDFTSAAAAELRIDGARITVGWDNWSGAFIMSWGEEGNTIINEIAKIF